MNTANEYDRDDLAKTENQQAEIERLKARLDDGCAEALRLQAEVERLRALCARIFKSLSSKDIVWPDDWRELADAASVRGEGKS